jgi:hypothetical protein
MWMDLIWEFTVLREAGGGGKKTASFENKQPRQLEALSRRIFGK